MKMFNVNVQAKVLGDGQEIVVEVSKSAFKQAGKLKLNRDALLHIVKCSAGKIATLNEDEAFFIEKGEGVKIPFVQNYNGFELEDCAVEFPDEKEDLQKSLTYFVANWKWKELRMALENRIGDLTKEQWETAKKALLDPKGDIGSFLKEMTIPKEGLYLLLNVYKKHNNTTYVEVVGVSKTLESYSAAMVIRLADVI